MSCGAKQNGDCVSFSFVKLPLTSVSRNDVQSSAFFILAAGPMQPPRWPCIMFLRRVSDRPARAIQVPHSEDPAGGGVDTRARVVCSRRLKHRPRCWFFCRTSASLHPLQYWPCFPCKQRSQNQSPSGGSLLQSSLGRQHHMCHAESHPSHSSSCWG